jgi:hypothetical protein
LTILATIAIFVSEKIKKKNLAQMLRISSIFHLRFSKKPKVCFAGNKFVSPSVHVVLLNCYCI